MIRQGYVGNDWRPTVKDCDSKIRTAKVLLEKGLWSPAEVQSLDSNWQELDLYTQDERNLAISNALSEIKATQYQGAKPPRRSTKDRDRDRELYSFCWSSEKFGMKMYFKFTIAADNNYMFVHSIHEARK